MNTDSFGDLTDSAEYVYGSFFCQNMECEGIAGRGEYDPETNVLVWYCPAGHRSRIKDFE